MSMPFSRTIDVEAKTLSKYSDDLDNFRRQYSLKEDSTTNENIVVKFVAPQISAFENYRFYLLQNSVTKPLQSTNYYRPDYVAYQEYGTPNLWAMLLFINDIPSIEDFNVDNILVPTPISISNLSLNISFKNLLQQLVPLIDILPLPTPPLFSKELTIPTYITLKNSLPIFTPSNIYFMRELFIVDVIMARQRYVDLKYEPVVESVVLNIKDNPTYLYDKYYKMIRGTLGFNRLTWDPRQLSNGAGLMSILVEGIQFEVTYARQVQT